MAGLAWGTARGTGGDGFVWTGAVRVPGAKAVRLHLSGVDLPEGASLYVFNRAGQAFGPYSGRGPLGDGELHTHTVFGEEPLLQLRSPAGAGRSPRLALAEVGAMGARFVLPRFGPQGAFDLDDVAAIAKASNLCAVNANCVVNAACQSSAAVNVAKDAIAGMLFQSGGSFYICTGGLFADSVTTSVIPYFLTANHCISTAGEAASLETYFDYQTTCSNPNCTQPYNNTGDGGVRLRGSELQQQRAMLLEQLQGPERREDLPLGSPACRSRLWPHSPPVATPAAGCGPLGALVEASPLRYWFRWKPVTEVVRGRCRVCRSVASSRGPPAE